MLTIITTTRDRSAAFQLLEDMVRRQTRQPDRWLVINDGQEKYEYHCGQEVILRDPSNDRLPSINENWLAALDHLEDCSETELAPREWYRGPIVCMEDDDWYAPNYLETVERYLRDFELVGFGYDRYWNVKTGKSLQLHNFLHASLAATAWRSSCSAMVRKAVEAGSVFIDLHLWHQFWQSDCSGYIAFNEQEETSGINSIPGAHRWQQECSHLTTEPGKPLHVGIKGLPGAVGLGIGHTDIGCPDSAGVTLRQWIGDDADVYLRFRRDHLTTHGTSAPSYSCRDTTRTD